jgi:hypothetical protein
MVLMPSAITIALAVDSGGDRVTFGVTNADGAAAVRQGVVDLAL